MSWDGLKWMPINTTCCIRLLTLSFGLWIEQEMKVFVYI